VDNVVDANVRAAFSSGATGRALNVACGVATTLRDLIAALSRIVGREIDPVCAEPRPGDITDSLADISLARSVLGYEPRVDVETGLRRLVAYVQQSLAKP
jgi:UDP-glucose 4-epimerase